MSTVYILKNQHDQYLDKSGEWVLLENSKTLYRTAHKDEAINRKVEFSVKNFELRISVESATLGANGSLDVESAQAGIETSDLVDLAEADEEADELLTQPTVIETPETAQATL